MRRECAVEGCGRSDIKGKGMCRKHYHRWYRTGDTSARPLRPHREECIVHDCSALDTGQSRMCAKHATRVLRHGDPEIVRPTSARGEANPRWTGDNATYSGLHQRVRKELGRAAEHQCVDCGRPALHWSYNNSGVEERVSTSAEPCGAGMRYSLDVNQYEPRCVVCHKKFDMNSVKEGA